MGARQAALLPGLSDKESRWRVLIIGTETLEFRPGGLARYVGDLSGALRRAGQGVEIVVLDRLVALSGLAGIGTILRCWTLYRRAQVAADHVDLLDLHFALYGLLPSMIGRLRKKPMIVHFHGPWAGESEVTGAGAVVVRLKRWIERYVYQKADRVVVLSKAFQNEVVRHYGIDLARVSVIPPGVDLEAFRPAGSDNVELRQQLNVAPDSFVVVCARRLERRMGIDMLLDAWRIVQQERDNAVLCLVGVGSEEDRLRQQAALLPDPSKVLFLGRVDDDRLTKLYQVADCTVVPTRALEGFGLVVLESLACGTPVVVTDVAGLPETVGELDQSLVVPAGDIAALSRRLLTAADGALPTWQRCRQHAQRFNWADAARRHLEIMSELGSKGSQPKRSRLTVAFVDHCAELSGGELALVRLLSRLDVDAHVYLAADGPLRARLEAVGATVHVLPLSHSVRSVRRNEVGILALPQALSSLGYVVLLAREFRRLKPDIVHTNSLKSALYGGVAGRLARIPTVWHIRDRISADYLSPSAVRIISAARHVLPSAVIANSRSTLDTVLPLRVPNEAIPSPVALSEGAPARDMGKSIRVGIVGRLAPWKGQDLFLRAFACSTAPALGATAVIVGAPLFGEEDYADKLEELVASLGLTGQVEMRGFREDVTSELTRLDVFVHASTIPEPFGQVIVEAMAAGLPVVVPNQGGPAEIVVDGVTGLQYDMGSPSSLANALDRLLLDPHLREQLGLTAKSAGEQYSPESVAARVEIFYRRILGERKGRALKARSKGVISVRQAHRSNK